MATELVHGGDDEHAAANCDWVTPVAVDRIGSRDCSTRAATSSTEGADRGRAVTRRTVVEGVVLTADAEMEPPTLELLLDDAVGVVEDVAIVMEEKCCESEAQDETLPETRCELHRATAILHKEHADVEITLYDCRRLTYRRYI